MAEQDQNQNPAPGGIPPKQMPFKPVSADKSDSGAPPNESDKPGTGGDDQPTEAQTQPTSQQPRSPIIVKRPVLRRPGEAAASPAGDVAKGIPVPPSEAAKKQTSRIDLPATEARGPGNDDIKTVKVKPATPPPKPGADPLPPGPKPLSPAQVQASKSKTSRISLEAALGAIEEMPPQKTMPKTIRLKRPSDLPAGASGGGAPAAPTSPGMQAPNLTAHLPTAKVATQQLGDLSKESDNSSITRRKTIKVKRPGAPSAVKVDATSDEPPEQEGSPAKNKTPSLPPGMKPIGLVEAESMHVAFVVGAAAALIVTLGLIWILAAQTFGPNAAVTGYTHASGPDIPAPIPGTVN